MKPWIKHTLSLVLVASLSACALAPNKEPAVTDGLSTKPKVQLPDDYAAALELLQQEQWGPAETALKAYAERSPRQSSPYVNLALLYRRSDRDEQALAALDQALEINPKQAAAFNLRGVYAREAGDFEAARDAYLSAIAADPQYPNAYLNMAILQDLYLHNQPSALRMYEGYAALVGEDNLQQKVKSWIADAKRQAQ